MGRKGRERRKIYSSMKQLKRKNLSSYVIMSYSNLFVFLYALHYVYICFIFIYSIFCSEILSQDPLLILLNF